MNWFPLRSRALPTTATRLQLAPGTMKGNVSGTQVTGVNAWSSTFFHASSPWKLRGRIWGDQMATLCQSISPACVWKQSLLDFPVTAAVEGNNSRAWESKRPLFVPISYSITERNSAIIQHCVFYRHKHQISGDGNDIKHADVAAALSKEGELWGKKGGKHTITITVGNTGGSQPCTLSWGSFLTTQQPPLAQNCGSLKPLSLSIVPHILRNRELFRGTHTVKLIWKRANGKPPPHVVFFDLCLIFSPPLDEIWLLEHWPYC